MDYLNDKQITVELRDMIVRETFKVETIVGNDSGNCPSPSCTGGNAMIMQGKCPDGFKPHHFWKLKLELTACRDCGHSVIATRNPDWKLPDESEICFD